MVRPSGRKIVLFGADSPHSEQDPFVVRLSEVHIPLDVLDCMTDIACRGWGATPADLLTLAELLLDDLDARRAAS